LETERAASTLPAYNAATDDDRSHQRRYLAWSFHGTRDWRPRSPSSGAELWSARVAEHSERNRGFTQASYVSGFEIVIPPTLDEQTAIAAVLSDMDAEIAALEAKLAKARGLK